MNKQQQAQELIDTMRLLLRCKNQPEKLHELKQRLIKFENSYVKAYGKNHQTNLN